MSFRPYMRGLLGSAAVVSAFDPGALFASGEQGAWYDPSDLTTLYQDSAGTTVVTADGDPVGYMGDKSGNGNHATQSTSAARPVYRTDGTLHWLEFDGVDDSLVTPTFTPGTDKVQVFAGVRKLSEGTSTLTCMSNNPSGSQGIYEFFAPLGSDGNYSFRSRGSTNSTATSADTFAPPTSNVITGLGDISGDLATLRIDGTQVAQSTADQGTTNYLDYPLYIGARAGSSLFFQGRIYSLTTRFGPNLDAATIGEAETYTADLAGVTI